MIGAGPEVAARAAADAAEAERARLEREALSRAFGHVVSLRVVILPAALALIGWIAWNDPSRWRRAGLSVAGAAITLFFVAEFLRWRRRGVEPASVERNLVAATAGQLAVALLSGGIESPFLPAAIPIGMLASVFTRPALRAALPIVQLAAVWAMAALAASGAIPDLNLAAFGGGPRVGADTAHVWAEAAMLSVLLVGSQLIGGALRRMFEAMLGREREAQRAALRVHAERAEELTALSGEIAHELKNPLASVKGLASLVAQELPPGKAAERLGVLRREADRMAAVLEDFLNFSRPLVPLALSEVNLGALAAEVAALHEGAAAARRLTLRAAGEAAARCDPRKVRQILVNLVQNALEASGPGGEVIVQVAPGEGGGARVAVLDRGAGLDPGLGARAFDVGVTTKPTGSGLGLTIARALARQHGGDVVLRSREGGGAEAALALPARPST